MYQNKTVAVVVPAYNEETQIEQVIATMPDFVDRIVIVNDGSKDCTREVVQGVIDQGCQSDIIIEKEIVMQEDSNYYYANMVETKIREEERVYYPVCSIYNENEIDRIVLINQENSRKGGALSNGYLWCRERNIDCIATMDGDGQMCPSELEGLIQPIICEGIDFTKGNRLSHIAAHAIIPPLRRFGNSVLSLLTKIASGYWQVSDSQTGYIAMSKRALSLIPIHRIYRDYGCPNDIMVMMNIVNASIREVDIKPVYNVGEQSKMKISRVIPRISALLVRCFFRRLFTKYFTNSFHPLFLFYSLGFLLFGVDFILFVRMVIQLIQPLQVVSATEYISFLVFLIMAIQSVGFAMFMDIQDNDKLNR